MRGNTHALSLSLSHARAHTHVYMYIKLYSIISYIYTVESFQQVSLNSFEGTASSTNKHHTPFRALDNLFFLPPPLLLLSSTFLSLLTAVLPPVALNNPGLSSHRIIKYKYIVSLDTKKLEHSSSSSSSSFAPFSSSDDTVRPCIHVTYARVSQ